MKNSLEHMPPALFASVMGLCGLSMAWERAHKILGFSSAINAGIAYLATFIWILLVILYCIKLIKFPRAVLKDLNHPVKLNFIAAIPIGALLLAASWLPINEKIAAIFWAFGVPVYIVFALLTLDKWIFRSQFQITQLNATWFIPIVGSVIVPLAGAKIAPIGDINHLFFSVGITFWLILFCIVLYRLFFHDPLPAKLAPTLFILVAPPAVGFSSYIRLGGELNAFSQLLYFDALFIALLLSLQIVRFIKTPFALSAWGYSFPLAALTAATFVMSEICADESQKIYANFGLFLLGVITLIIAFLFIRTLAWIFSGKVFVAE